MQKELKNSVKITDADYEDVPEVDIKLLKLAKDLNGKVVTNDYNLNKVAAVQDVPVFNINELANAVKPILMAGEEMTVTIVKDGKEASQGVAYLDDGTMIVVEGAKGREGETMGCGRDKRAADGGRADDICQNEIICGSADVLSALPVFNAAAVNPQKLRRSEKILLTSCFSCDNIVNCISIVVLWRIGSTGPALNAFGKPIRSIWKSGVMDVHMLFDRE